MPYIEFVGPPGSGKTTAARALLAAENEMGVGRRSLVGAENKKRVGKLGLPLGSGAVRPILRGLPSDLSLVLLFLRELSVGPKIRVWRTLTFFSALLKSRILADSPIFWVIDQGLQQQILTCRARGWLTVEQALRWKHRCMATPYGPVRLCHVILAYDELCQRIEASDKHRTQAGVIYISEYVAQNLSAYSDIYGSNKGTVPLDQ